MSKRMCLLDVSGCVWNSDSECVWIPHSSSASWQTGSTRTHQRLAGKNSLKGALWMYSQRSGIENGLFVLQDFVEFFHFLNDQTLDSGHCPPDTGSLSWNSLLKNKWIFYNVRINLLSKIWFLLSAVYRDQPTKEEANQVRKWKIQIMMRMYWCPQ